MSIVFRVDAWVVIRVLRVGLVFIKLFWSIVRCQGSVVCFWLLTGAVVRDDACGVLVPLQPAFSDIPSFLLL
jgi:hypothetical protein